MLMSNGTKKVLGNIIAFLQKVQNLEFNFKVQSISVFISKVMLKKLCLETTKTHKQLLIQLFNMIIEWDNIIGNCRILNELKLLIMTITVPKW